MNYRPSLKRELWDTWIFPWQGKYHLFYLETQDTLWDHIGRAVSDDMVNWEVLPSIPVKRDSEDWPISVALTGMTVHRDGKFYMFIGTSQEGQQVVGCFLSDDLETWKFHPASPVMKSMGPHYLVSPCTIEIDWRDPCIVQDKDGMYHAFLCARTSVPDPDDTGAAIAHLTSYDLIKWKHLPPVAQVGYRFFHTEVPDLFELDGKYYMCFNTITNGGMRIVTPSREGVCGTFYMIGDSLTGPFELPEDPLLIGEGKGKVSAYVGRTIDTEFGRVLYHHIQSDRPALGLPKLVKANSDSTLYLQYFPIVEKLRKGLICEGICKCMTDEGMDKLGTWEIADGKLVGRANAASGYCTVAQEFINGEICCTVSSSNSARTGLVIRSRKDRGIGIAIDYESQRMLLAMVDREPNYGWGTPARKIFEAKGEILHETCKMELTHDKQYHLRCIVREEFVEVYLEDRWVFTSVIRNELSSGDVEAWSERGKSVFSDFLVASWDSIS